MKIDLSHPHMQFSLRCDEEITELIIMEEGAVADLRWCQGHPRGPNSFNFMQFLGKFDKIVCWHPHWRVGTPTSGKSWIRHWIVNHNGDCITLLYCPFISLKLHDKLLWWLVSVSSPHALLGIKFFTSCDE